MPTIIQFMPYGRGNCLSFSLHVEYNVWLFLSQLIAVPTIIIMLWSDQDYGAVWPGMGILGNTIVDTC